MQFDIEKHEIYLDFIEELNPIAIKFHEANKKEQNPVLSEREEFVFDIFQRLNEIDNKLKDLNYSIMFFSVYPNYKPWRSKITRQEYIIYHLEYYYINIVALFDRLLHLVNFIYDLGLADQFVTLKSITTNKHVKKESIRILKKIDKALRGIRNTQNKIKHKKKLQDKEMYYPSLLEFQDRQNMFEKYDKGLQKELKSEINFFYRIYLNQKKKELENNNQALGGAVKSLLDNILPIYKTRKSNSSE